MTTNHRNENGHFFFLRTLKGNHRIGVVVMMPFVADGNSVRISASLCSKNDSWNKNLGMLKAYSRLDSPRYSQDLPIGDITFELKNVLRKFGKCGLLLKKRGVNIAAAQALFKRELEYLARKYGQQQTQSASGN